MTDPDLCRRIQARPADNAADDTLNSPVSTATAAKIVGVSPRTITEWCKAVPGMSYHGTPGRSIHLRKLKLIWLLFQKIAKFAIFFSCHELHRQGSGWDAAGFRSAPLGTVL
jgi:hypothetical protein